MQPTGFEQFTVGQVFTSAAQTVDETAIKAFAEEYDNQAQHMDDAAAERTMFGRLVASGWHTAAITMRLLLDSALAGISGRTLGTGVREITWPTPVLPGDALHAVTEVLEVRASRSKPDRGMMVVQTTTLNQHGKAVQAMTSTLIVLRSDAVL